MKFEHRSLINGIAVATFLTALANGALFCFNGAHRCGRKSLHPLRTWIPHAVANPYRLPIADHRRTKAEFRILSCMDEARKRVFGIMAAILAARKLCQLESTWPSPALQSIIADAVIFAERILQRIDAEWPVRSAQSDQSN
jgi:hypothetical protein